MFLEIFARTFVWIVYIMLSSVFLRLFGIYKKVSESLLYLKIIQNYYTSYWACYFSHELLFCKRNIPLRMRDI